MGSTPNQAGFLTFVRNVMGISMAVLPDNSVAIPYAYEIARAIVNTSLAQVPIANLLPGISTVYDLAVYNLAGSNLINFAQDVPGAPDILGSSPPAPYFENLRQRWNITGFVSGVIQSASDEGTSESMVVQKAAEDFTLADLQLLKDPYGRQYLALAQKYGPNIWGLT